MDGLVKLIWAFWIIVVAGVVLAIVMANPFLLIVVGIFLLASIIVAIDVHFEKKKVAQSDADEENLTTPETLNSEKETTMAIKATETDNEISKTVPEDISPSKTISEHSQDSIDNSLPRVQLEDFDLLNGVQFKNLIEKHFKKQGYSVNKISPRINSIDFLIEKDNTITVVATKHTFDLIQRSYVNNVIESAKMYSEASKTMIITTSMYFMPPARQLADEYDIILWDREILKSQLGGLK